jgi:hypothetical protein
METLLITNITTGLQNDIIPSKKTYIIVLATVIPSVVILSIIIIIYLKRSSSTNILTTISRPFTNLNKNKKSTNDYELDQVEDESAF